ncbi:hypothetical protein [Streptomyces sp. NPDC015131]|uniref:hypothetical protein n=1 Tax=Streptomyces sp. NPDC015131 TaxID=3364941 RepID=UPI0036F8CDBD
MKHNKVRVWKMAGTPGIWLWQCSICKDSDEDVFGASVFWEIAQYQADEHVRERHRPARHLSRDAGTPPGGTHIDWSDTGMHLRVREEDG